MHIGHMVFSSKSQAIEEMGENEFVWCPECLQVERVGIADYGFGDNFGGVTDWRAVTDCGNEPDGCITECMGCGKKLEEDMALHQIMYNRTNSRRDWKDDWFCDVCYKDELEGK